MVMLMQLQGVSENIQGVLVLGRYRVLQNYRYSHWVAQGIFKCLRRPLHIFSRYFAANYKNLLNGYMNDFSVDNFLYVRDLCTL